MDNSLAAFLASAQDTARRIVTEVKSHQLDTPSERLLSAEAVMVMSTGALATAAAITSPTFGDLANLKERRSEDVSAFAAKAKEAAQAILKDVEAVRSLAEEDPHARFSKAMLTIAAETLLALGAAAEMAA